MPLGSINYLAVVVGTVFNMVLGFLWYGPILGKVWMAQMEKAGRKMEDMKGSGGMYAFTLIVAFVSSAVLALIIEVVGASSIGEGILWGAVVWIGVGAATSLTSGMFEGRRVALWVISSLYYLIVYVAQGVLYVLWP